MTKWERVLAKQDARRNGGNCVPYPAAVFGPSKDRGYVRSIVRRRARNRQARKMRRLQRNRAR